MRKIFSLLTLTGAGILIFFIFFRGPDGDSSGFDVSSLPAASLETQKEGDVPGVTLLFVGDIMLARAIGSIAERKNDPLFYFRSTRELVRRADVAVANLESPLSTRGTKMGSELSFRAQPKMSDGLSFAGFDVVSLANNHIWDYGPDALLDTLDILSQKQILYAGAGRNYARAHAPALYTVRGTQIAFLSYTDLLAESHTRESSLPAVAFADKGTVAADILGARRRADIVVVLLHWGEEYSTRHSKAQEELARAAIDAGAHLVIGHHPHVVQEVEEYNGGLIAYSLGNFIFDQNFSEETSRGLMLRVIMSGQEISLVEKIPITFSPRFEPILPERFDFPADSLQ